MVAKRSTAPSRVSAPTSHTSGARSLNAVRSRGVAAAVPERAGASSIPTEVKRRSCRQVATDPGRRSAQGTERGAPVGVIFVRLPRMPRSRVAILTLGALVLIVAVVVVVIAFSAGSPQRALPPPVTRTGLQTILEDESDLHANPNESLSQLKRLGVGRVRVYLPWGSVAPDPTSRHRPAGFDATDPAAYPAASWAIYDEIIRDVKAHGMGLDFTVGSPPPLWAQGPGDPGRPAHPQWRVSSQEFGLFMQAVGKRYSGNYTPAGDSLPLPHVGFWS